MFDETIRRFSRIANLITDGFTNTESQIRIDWDSAAGWLPVVGGRISTLVIENESFHVYLDSFAFIKRCMGEVTPFRIIRPL